MPTSMLGMHQMPAIAAVKLGSEFHRQVLTTITYILPNDGVLFKLVTLPRQTTLGLTTHSKGKIWSPE